MLTIIFLQAFHGFFKARWARSQSCKKNKGRPVAVVVRNTGRFTNEPPDYISHDFGFDCDWYEANKSVYAEQVRDFFTYGDPPGFGTGVNGSQGPELNETVHGSQAQGLEEDRELEYTDWISWTKCVNHT